MKVWKPNKCVNSITVGIDGRQTVNGGLYMYKIEDVR